MGNIKSGVFKSSYLEDLILLPETQELSRGYIFASLGVSFSWLSPILLFFTPGVTPVFAVSVLTYSRISFQSVFNFSFATYCIMLLFFVVKLCELPRRFLFSLSY